MSLLDGIDVFGSGPHSIRPGAWERNLLRREFPGLDGELVLNLGLRGRTITQVGRLQATGAAALQGLLSRIEAFHDGAFHTLVDAYGQTFAKVVLVKFELPTSIQRGRGCWCQYALEYRQLP